jgi:transcriptional regulator with XRE-family HTH domain
MAKNNLKQFSTDKGVTGADLSREAGLASNTISKAMNGRKIAPVTMAKISNAFNRICKTSYKPKEIFPSYPEDL